MVKIKEGFKGERILSLPQGILHDYSREPMLRPLYIRKMGYFPKVQYHYVQKEHGAPYCMLIYCVDGQGWLRLGGGEVQAIPANHYVLLPMNVPYSFGASDAHPWTIYWIHFAGTLAPGFVQYPVRPHPVMPASDSRLQERIDLFGHIYDSFAMAYTPGYMHHACMCLYAFLSSFIHLAAYRCGLQAPQQPDFATQVIHYMHEHVSTNLTLHQLAAYFKYSPSHFSALFQQHTGYPPIGYYIQLKMRKACEYMELTSLRIGEIAARVGFDDPSYFSRLFTKVMGLSPTEYRRQECLKAPQPGVPRTS